MPGPHADFACLAKKCRTENGSATVYDLPVTATRCPVCGSKRVQRLYTAVNVASGMARAVDRIADAPITAALAQKDAAKAARNRPADQVRQAPAISVPIGQLAGTLRAMGRPVQVGETARPVPRPAVPVQQVFRGRLHQGEVVARHTPKAEQA